MTVVIFQDGANVQTQNMPPIIIGISGGSGSGKTTLAKKIQALVGAEKCSILSQDNYYLDQSKKFREDGGSEVNFDHPGSIDFALLAAHLQKLRLGLPVDIPTYDFSTHSRLKATIKFAARPVVIVDGTLVLSQAMVREKFDYKIFMDIPEEVRFARRLKRDVAERGRTPEGVEKQFFAQVKPMHEEFVQPSCQYADWVVSDDVQIEKMLSEIIKIIA